MKLVASDLSCVRGARPLFRNLSFSLAQGELVLVQGPNGTGKSTLLQIMAGILTPTAGAVLWEGCNINNNNACYAEKRSYLGHKDPLNKNLTVDENIAMHLALVNKKGGQAEQLPLLADLSLIAQRAQLFGTLSAGQRRKTALAALILKSQPLWILDEPFTALDTGSIHQMERRFDQHLAQGGMIMMASHHTHHFSCAAKITAIDCSDGSL